MPAARFSSLFVKIICLMHQKVPVRVARGITLKLPELIAAFRAFAAHLKIFLALSV